MARRTGNLQAFCKHCALSSACHDGNRGTGPCGRGPASIRRATSTDELATGRVPERRGADGRHRCGCDRLRGRRGARLRAARRRGRHRERDASSFPQCADQLRRAACCGKSRASPPRAGDARHPHEVRSRLGRAHGRRRLQHFFGHDFVFIADASDRIVYTRPAHRRRGPAGDTGGCRPGPHPRLCARPEKREPRGDAPDRPARGDAEYRAAHARRAGAEVRGPARLRGSRDRRRRRRGNGGRRPDHCRRQVDRRSRCWRRSAFRCN